MGYEGGALGAHEVEGISFSQEPGNTSGRHVISAALGIMNRSQGRSGRQGWRFQQGRVSNRRNYILQEL